MTTVIHTIAELREALAPVRRSGRGIGLVPTMGALHAGHGALIEEARVEGDEVVVSLFVNPTQFNDPGDLAAYPRTLQEDRRFCEAEDVHWLFAPSAEEMYPEPLKTQVRVADLSAGLCGAGRPGHFEGVATVCTKLFSIVQPDKAYFGEKDFQQLVVIRRLVRDLNLPLEIVGVETVREPDGLALSSRNRLLSPEQRRAALAISQSLSAAQQAARSGETDVSALRAAALGTLAQEPALQLEYLEIVDPDSLVPLDRLDGPGRVMTAVQAGEVRLIDNMPLP